MQRKKIEKGEMMRKLTLLTTAKMNTKESRSRQKKKEKNIKDVNTCS